ncbi:MAG: ABC transporter permease [Alphaproteobacteria bacterium]|nr:ABC transporter permease [Alphaproteobacteria bacterium]
MTASPSDASRPTPPPGVPLADRGRPPPGTRRRLSQGLGPRRFGAVNWLGLWSLYVKEVRRFLNVATQTVAAPVVTTLLFLAIFTLALGRSVDVVQGAPFSQFLAPGLIMMAMVQNAFANTSSSLVISKIQGNIVDVLMPPISPGEMVLAYAAAGVTRGLVVGLSVGVAMVFFVTVEIHHLWAVLFFSVAASLMLAVIGILAGVWADKFDHMAAITNFVITPFAFLSGTFYSIERLPQPFYDIAHLNPFFYMIDGFRYGFIGSSDASPWLGAAVMTAMNAGLLLAAWILVRRGWKLKA